MSTILNSMKEVYRERNLLFSMVVRDFKGKYRNSFFGFLWHFINPMLLIILFYIVFTSIRVNPIDHYWIYLCVGMFPFAFFRDNLQSGTGCILSNGNMIKKMYFPREILVFSRIISTFITLLITYCGTILVSIAVGFALNPLALVFLPLMLILSFIFAMGYVFFLSAITVFIRDIQHVMAVVGRVVFWTTPIFYLASEANDILGKIIWYNPLTYFIECYHNILYFSVVPDSTTLMVCFFLTIISFVIGAVVFNKLKGKFAERL